MDKITSFLTALLGANWRTTISGTIALLASVIYFKNDLVAFLPEHFRSWVIGISGIIAVASGAGFVAVAKDAKVTGGTKPSTEEAEERIKPDNVADAVQKGKLPETDKDKK